MNLRFKKFKPNNKIVLSISFIIFYILPLSLTLWNVLSGSLAFWYDPARDFILAQKNLSDPTLIGPPTGIPGIFYGPYWIWLISIGLIASPDPRIVTLITQTIPYFTVFPLILYQFKKIFGLVNIILIWILFILGFNGYASQLWNPNLSPLFLLVILYLVTFTNFESKSNKTIFRVVLVGVFTGIALNFHISFNIGLTLSIIIFLLLNLISSLWKNKTNRMIIIKWNLLIFSAFFFGFLLTYIPFLLFEIKHDFHQFKTILTTLSTPHAVVGQIGLNNLQILQYFFGKLHTIFRLTQGHTAIISIGLFLYVLFYLTKEKLDLNKDIIRLFTLISITVFMVLGIYLVSKNPVWDYHFINVEILLLFMLFFIARRFLTLQKILLLYTLVLLSFTVISITRDWNKDPYRLPWLKTKEHIVKIVAQDAGNKPYSVYIYNPAIYTYDYSYLFKWIAEKDVPYDPGQIKISSDVVYLIIPETSSAIRDDQIQFRTPNDIYTTTDMWKVGEGTTVYKREKR